MGDVLKKFGVNFPMYSVRYKNMLEDYYAPTNVTIRLFGLYNDDLASNVKEQLTGCMEMQNYILIIGN